ncbi:hypothetical protein [Streptomyces sp. H27-D2]|uniref:hypothetical protein n=1 Tax=Streptomyces sp. H27-D2 TaxID=3046304 RepID=UPI002DB9E352|nr:hypothetical protein [Streptomyces sp. H27-D2]MEC4017833.1 hypothetical protein [Streptomyces sp. H27-D2]
MINPIPRGWAAAAVVMTAAAALLSGCASDDGQRDSGTPAASGRPAASPSAPASTPSAGADKKPAEDKPAKGDKKSGGKGGTGPNAAGPTVPSSGLTPATGSFTKKQKTYLADRVPQGDDPAAVLDLGNETCERIARTAKQDRKAAVSAIRDDEMEGAADAVTHLCPKYKYLLEAAGVSGKGGTG